MMLSKVAGKANSAIFARSFHNYSSKLRSNAGYGNSTSEAPKDSSSQHFMQKDENSFQQQTKSELNPPQPPKQEVRDLHPQPPKMKPGRQSGRIERHPEMQSTD
eukprot:TRINITY_DN1081_c0_g2_i4.p2 TRINITY_DN1081_c0_g2~~TRINITY_DN1081_c0_g2_i4.p2  ORF type:complete len:104 (-),score=9.50 TRINITY_DN1081_c0_g2_i4:50-361(-)